MPIYLKLCLSFSLLFHSLFLSHHSVYCCSDQGKCMGQIKQTFSNWTILSPEWVSSIFKFSKKNKGNNNIVKISSNFKVLKFYCWNLNINNHKWRGRFREPDWKEGTITAGWSLLHAKPLFQEFSHVNPFNILKSSGKHPHPHWTGNKTKAD